MNQYQADNYNPLGCLFITSLYLAEFFKKASPLSPFDLMRLKFFDKEDSLCIICD